MSKSDLPDSGKRGAAAAKDIMDFLSENGGTTATEIAQGVSLPMYVVSAYLATIVAYDLGTEDEKGRYALTKDTKAKRDAQTRRRKKIKNAIMLALERKHSGLTLNAIAKAIGWPTVVVRGFLRKLVRDRWVKKNTDEKPIKYTITKLGQIHRE